MFGLETVERDIARGQGHVSAVAAANNLVFCGTSGGSLLRFDFADGSASGTNNYSRRFYVVLAPVKKVTEGTPDCVLERSPAPQCDEALKTSTTHGRDILAYDSLALQTWMSPSRAEAPLSTEFS